MALSEWFWEIRRHFFKKSYPRAVAPWPLRLPAELSPDELDAIRRRADALDEAAQYGWGQSIDFGPFRKEGFLDIQYLEIAGLYDKWGWWPSDLSGMRVADLGCFTGGHSLLMASRGADKVYALDEVPEHLDQCRFLYESFGLANIELIESSIYHLGDRIPEGSLDLVVCSGVLYHMSDMLVGLLEIRRLLKPGGLLLLETNAVDDHKRSFANFGRYYGGMWWQPSGLCVRDLCEYTGFEKTDLRFYKPDRCLARALRDRETEIPFKRGMNRDFESLADAERRTMDRRVMAPVKPRLW